MNTLELPERTRVQRVFTMLDPDGLHARPAALFARTVSQFEATITVHCRGFVASGKSVLGLLRLCVGKGERLTVIADGNDSDRSLQALEAVFRQHGFMRSA